MATAAIIAGAIVVLFVGYRLARWLLDRAVRNNRFEGG